MDFKAICNGLAARYAPGTIPTPTGAVAMRSSWGQAPNGPKPTPFTVVMPQDGSLTYGAQWVDSEHDIDVLFFLSKAPGDVARVETQRQLWLPVLLAATHGAAQFALGLAPTVKKAIPTSYEFTELPYGGDQYDGIRITFRVFVGEAATFSP